MQIMTTDEALKWIAELFEESPENVTSETAREDIPAWDSLGVLTLMASLDENFDILLTEQDLRGMKKVDDILAILRNHQKLV